MPGPRLHPYRSPLAEYPIATHARALGFDVEIARLLIGERTELRTLGKFRDGKWVYSVASAERIAAALRQRRAG